MFCPLGSSVSFLVPNSIYDCVKVGQNLLCQTEPDWIKKCKHIDGDFENQPIIDKNGNEICEDDQGYRC